jgi:hypothetical protein
MKETTGVMARPQPRALLSRLSGFQLTAWELMGDANQVEQALENCRALLGQINALFPEEIPQRSRFHRPRRAPTPRFSHQKILSCCIAANLGREEIQARRP